MTTFKGNFNLQCRREDALKLLKIQKQHGIELKTFMRKQQNLYFLTDVDECDGNPCGANGQCSESRQGLPVSHCLLSGLGEFR